MRQLFTRSSANSAIFFLRFSLNSALDTVARERSRPRYGFFISVPMLPCEKRHCLRRISCRRASISRTIANAAGVRSSSPRQCSSFASSSAFPRSPCCTPCSSRRCRQAPALARAAPTAKPQTTAPSSAYFSRAEGARQGRRRGSNRPTLAAYSSYAWPKRARSPGSSIKGM